jgi:CubicO group peptidase (beta-lactamase class C family)
MKSLGILMLGLSLLAPASAVAEEVTTVDLPEQVDAVFADYDSTASPGCSLGVIQDGDLVYARGYGMASLDHGVPLGPRSVFRIASTSKQFTAFAIQLLVDRGKIDLDSDVRTYLPELPEYERPVTVRQLIHHTSGYRDYLALTYLAGMRDDDYYTDAEVLDLLSRQRELNFPPNSQHLYSNSGYFLLGQIVLRVSGKTLREFAAEEIFSPLGMRQTHFHDDHNEIVPGRAVGYSPTENGGYEISLTTLEMIGDGGVFTSVEDLARWDANFYEPKAGTAATLDRMLEPGVLDNGEELDYASALVVSDYHGLRKIQHGGAFVGYRAQMIRFPDQRLSVICLCNRGDASPSRLAQKVADLYLAEHLPEDLASENGEEDVAAEEIELPVESLDAFVGGYQRENAVRVIYIEREDDGLVAAFAREARFPIRPVAENRFAGETWGRRFEVVFEGERAIFYYGADRDERPYVKVELAEPSAEAVAGIAGDYRCDELMTKIQLRAEGGELWLSHENPHKEKPENAFVPTVADTFESDGFTIQVDRGENGGVEQVRLGVGRVRNIACVAVG